jgi:hypothetical protein
LQPEIVKYFFEEKKSKRFIHRLPLGRLGVTRRFPRIRERGGKENFSQSLALSKSK